MTNSAAQTVVTVSVEGEAWFRSSRSAWNGLLAASRANALFSDWDWLHAWWQHFGPELGARPAILVARNDDGEIVGIAPFLLRRSGARRPWSIAQLAPIGNVWRQNVGEVTEHIDWIVRTGCEETVQRALVAQLARMAEWDELLVAYASADSIGARGVHVLAAATGCYVRRERPLEHYAVDTDRSFAEFTRRLGAHTRQRVQQRRKLLGKLGKIALVAATADNVSTQLDKLEHLSRLRWGKGLGSSTRQFYEELARAMLAKHALHFSTLEVDGRPISALFDVRAGDAVYNIRSALDAGFNKRLSPGLLHLGYAIEQACGTPGIRRYELLAGDGKQTNFKRSIATATGSFVSLQLLRRPHEKLVFRAYDALVRR
jgi:CelD/BcsL family acetyltransferase involved in cellulose biosynthesis